MAFIYEVTMAPKKKKDKPKASEWLQCSLSGKLITSQDADIHGTSFSADHSFIQNRVFRGKVIDAETLLREDGSPVTKSIREPNSAVWLAVQTMQVCGLSIGQPCVVNGVLVKRSWPHEAIALANMALTRVSREEMGIGMADYAVVERFCPDDSLFAESAVLRLREDNPVFETKEFAAFVSGYLDGKFIALGSPLQIRYFGQTCFCDVERLEVRPSPSVDSSAVPGLPVSPSNHPERSLPATPVRDKTGDVSSACSTPASTMPTPEVPRTISGGGGDGDVSIGSTMPTPEVPRTISGGGGDGDVSIGSTLLTPEVPRTIGGGGDGAKDVSIGPDTPDVQASSISGDLAESFASINISDSMSPACLTSTPTGPHKHKNTNFITPVKEGVHTARTENSSSCPVFARVSSQVTVFSVKGLSSEDDSLDADSMSSNRGVSIDDVGGLTTQIEELKMRIAGAQHARSSSRCILLHGPPGTGKTLLAKAITSHLGLPTTLVAGTDIWSKLFGEAESNLRKIFKAAQDKAPSIIVIDDMDVICPKRSQNSAGQQEHRIVGTLLSLIDDISSKKNASRPVVVVGVTSNRDGLDPALRRAGRFGCEIEIGVPTAPQRAEILQTLLRHVPHTLSESDIVTVASNAHGYVGADLTALVNEASMHSLSANRNNRDSGLQPNTVTMGDLVYAGQHVKPSALREIQLEVPQVHWSDIGGMCEVKMRLREAVELPLSHPEIFQKLGIEPPQGLLMYGPPGCSKTMVARALATECKLNFLAVKGPELFNQYVGESEKAIREVFRKARSAAPSVIFFDEIDAIAAKRGSSSGGSGVDDRVLTQLLTEMDGLEFLKDVFIMAATNRPDKIDNALLRPGRFDSLVYVPLPDAPTRRDILQKKFVKMAVVEGLSLEGLVEATDGYSGAEVVQVCQEAALCALRESLDATEVAQCHFDVALEKVKPQITQELLEVYTRFSQASIK